MPPPSWSAILEVQDPDGTRTRHPFRHPRIAVGRKKQNDLWLADDAVSSEHCEFVSEAGWFVVRDLGSVNGTFVNEKRVSKARLRDGDEVRIGGTRIRVALQGEVRGLMPRKQALWPPWIGARSRRAWGLSLAALVALAGGAAWFLRSAAQESLLREKFVTALRDHSRRDPCSAAGAQLAALSAVDAQIGGRSVAIALDRGEIRLSKPDEIADLMLLGLYRRKLELYGAARAALVSAQQGARESLERVSRAGQKLASGKDRKLALWAESLLQDGLKAGDDLSQGVEKLAAETGRLAALVEAVVVRREAPLAAQLAHFRFSENLETLLDACRAQAARTASGIAGPLAALEE
ncbi:MAG TPA: FHA domain-containing protein [Myxococcales bacterium]